MRKLIRKISRIYRRFKYRAIMMKEALRQVKVAKEHYFKIELAFLYEEDGWWKTLRAWKGITEASYLQKAGRLVVFEGIDIYVDLEKIKRLIKERF